MREIAVCLGFPLFPSRFCGFPWRFSYGRAGIKLFGAALPFKPPNLAQAPDWAARVILPRRCVGSIPAVHPLDFKTVFQPGV